MHRITGGIDIKPDRRGHLGVSVEDLINEQPLDGVCVGGTLIVARGFGLAQFQSIQPDLLAASLPASTAIVGSCRS
jgi:hypothetical protein